jgi:hypothetical protein
MCGVTDRQTELIDVRNGKSNIHCVRAYGYHYVYCGVRTELWILSWEKCEIDLNC